MASLKERIARFQPVSVINLPSPRIDIPDVLQEHGVTQQWGLLGISQQYPILQPAEPIADPFGSELPLSSHVEQNELMQPISIEQLPTKKNIPLQSQVISADGEEEIFKRIDEAQPYPDNLLVCLTSPSDAPLPERFRTGFVVGNG